MTHNHSYRPAFGWVDVKGTDKEDAEKAIYKAFAAESTLEALKKANIDIDWTSFSPVENQEPETIKAGKLTFVPDGGCVFIRSESNHEKAKDELESFLASDEFKKTVLDLGQISDFYLEFEFISTDEE